MADKRVYELPLAGEFADNDEILVTDVSDTSSVAESTAFGTLKRSTWLNAIVEIGKRTCRRWVIPSAPNGAPNIVHGHELNDIASDLYGCTVGGGGYDGRENVIGGVTSTVGTGTPNVTKLGTAANVSVITGGYDNVASGLASIINGFHNQTQEGSTHGTIGGGSFQKIEPCDYSTIGGGTLNTISGSRSVVAGGKSNTASAANATISGGENNVASGGAATVMGGANNTASGAYAVTGGARNTASATDTVAFGDTCVASAEGATVSGGQDNTASGISATIPGGADNVASGAYAVAVGNTNQATANYAVAVGARNVASGVTSVATGDGALASNPGQEARSVGTFAATGDAQYSTVGLRRLTTDATPALLSQTSATANNSTQLQPDSTAFVTVRVVARDVSSGDGKVWKAEFAVNNPEPGNVVALGGTPAFTVVGQSAGASAWAISAPVFGANSVSIQVAGEAGKSIRWVGKLDLVEVVG